MEDKRAILPDMGSATHIFNPLGLYVTNLTWGEVVTTGGDAQIGNGGNSK